MSRRDDDRYVDEMTDAAAERLLAGRTVPEHPELSGIVGALRAEANGPAPAPSAALAALLRDGFTPPAAAPAAPPPRARLLSRVTGLGLLAKSTVAAGAAVFVVAGAGAAGALPGASQDVFADVVNAVTPFRVGATERPAEADSDTDAGTDADPAETPAPEDEAPEQPADDERAEPAPETAAPDDAETPAPSDEPTTDAEPDDADASEEPLTDESEEYEDSDDTEPDEEPADDEGYDEDPAEEGDPEEEEPADEEEPDDDPAGGLLRLEY